VSGGFRSSKLYPILTSLPARDARAVPQRIFFYPSKIQGSSQTAHGRKCSDRIVYLGAEKTDGFGLDYQNRRFLAIISRFGMARVSDSK
jgi:hypothetical protein